MSSEHLSEEPQSQRGAQGSRDTGSNTAGGGSTDRPAGTFDQEEVTSARDQNPEGDVATTGTLPPADVESAVPPYEGRRTSADEVSGTAGGGSARTAGATHPVTDPDFKAPAPGETPGGTTASPAEEQPASQAPETEATDEGAAEGGHHGGVRRAEDQPRETRAQ